MPTKRMSIRTPLYIATASAFCCAFIWLCRGIYLYWNDVRLINFLAAWIPFVLSILLAFVPEHKMSTKKKLIWRGSVIFVGFAWSVVLWHQQVITDEASKRDQKTIVTEAVTQSSIHADQQIGNVRSDVQNVKNDLEAKINDTVSRSTSSLNESIGRVNKPVPPEVPRLQFTLWKAEMQSAEFPILASSIRPDKDGTFSIDFTFSNLASTSADAV